MYWGLFGGSLDNLCKGVIFLPSSGRCIYFFALVVRCVMYFLFSLCGLVSVSTIYVCSTDHCSAMFVFQEYRKGPSSAFEKTIIHL